MISISLHSKANELIEVTSHPEYVDFPVRDSRTRISVARLEMANENFVAPIVAGLNRRTAIDTYLDLTRAAAELAQKHPGREDGKRVLEYLATWGRPHPQARWEVIGAEALSKHGRFIECATIPRLSETSLTADPLAKGVRFIGEAERMDEMEIDDLSELLGLGPAWEDISGAALLQREVPIQGTGGGSKSKIGRKKKGASAGMVICGIIGSTPPGYEYDETPIAREVLSMRVDTVAKTALQESGVGRELIEELGRALARGTAIDVIRAGLGVPPANQET